VVHGGSQVSVTRLIATDVALALFAVEPMRAPGITLPPRASKTQIAAGA
jgi:hypothetical protein